jgi:hypothetical protein
MIEAEIGHGLEKIGSRSFGAVINSSRNADYQFSLGDRQGI